jgi:hypothetical protein
VSLHEADDEDSDSSASAFVSETLSRDESRDALQDKKGGP